MKLWIAREKDGSLWLFNVKPEFNGKEWVTPGADGLSPDDYCLINDILPEVTFENSPKAVELRVLNE